MTFFVAKGKDNFMDAYLKAQEINPRREWGKMAKTMVELKALPMHGNKRRRIKRMKDMIKTLFKLESGECGLIKVVQPWKTKT